MIFRIAVAEKRKQKTGEKVTKKLLKIYWRVGGVDPRVTLRCVHVFLNGCNFRCLLLENFEVLESRKCGQKIVANFRELSRLSHLWLNWVSDSEIMHFEEESRAVWWGDISRAWSDVSRAKVKVNLCNFTPQFFFFPPEKSIEITFLVIFRRLRARSMPSHPRYRDSDFN